MELYNEHYIQNELIGIIDLLRTNTLSYQLIFNSLSNRYSYNFKANVDGSHILLKESLDHYITRNYLKDKVLEPKYIDIIKKDVEIALKNKNQIRPLHNHFLNTISNDELEKILPKDLFQTICEIKERQRAEEDWVMGKINRNEPIPQSELEFICDCFAFNRKKDDQNHQKLIEYIFNTLPKKNCGLLATPLVSDAINAFIPKVFTTKENKDFINTRIVNYYNPSFIGQGTFLGFESCGDVYVDRRHYFFIDFKKIDDANNLCDNESVGYISYLQTVFHELTHVDQNINESKKTFSDNGYMSIVSKILRENLDDYNLNHDNYEIEVDADQKAWLHTKEFFQRFVKNEKLKSILIPKFNENSVANHSRRSTLQKVDSKTKRMQETDFFDIEKLNEIIRNKPSLVKAYPMLKTFYDEHGFLKLDFLSKPEISKSIVGTNYTKYVIATKTNEIKEKIKYNTNKKSFSNMVGSIYSAAMNELHREKASSFSEDRNINSDRQDHKSKYTLQQIRNRNIRILTNAFDILNNPYTINRKTTFFSPITYINRLAEKMEEHGLEPAIARSR